MNDAEKRELIDELCDAARCEDAHLSNADHEVVDMQLRAAAALEAALWKPIADMPDELKDGRSVFVWRPELKGYHKAHADADRWNAASWQGSWRDAQPTHYQEITTPEEAGDESA